MNYCRFLILLAVVTVAGAFEQAQIETALKDRALVIPTLTKISAELPTLSATDAVVLSDAAAPLCRALFRKEPLPSSEHFGIVVHRVAKGEYPSVIARKYKCSVEVIARLNPDYDPRTLRIGQELRVFDLASVPLDVVISRSAYRLMLWRGSNLIGAFRCGLGRHQSPTPLGSTQVTMCVRNPEWRDPDTGTVFKPGDPGNVLGGYWIGFEHGDDKTFNGIGIHGFTAEHPDQWLEQNGSHGCIRLTQDDIALVFDLIRPGARVVIRD